jgi:hypothetical protein
MGDDTKSAADSLREVAATVNNLATKLDDLAVKVERLAPLAPMASKLAKLPEKVVTLQSSAFENGEQVRALNLALIRLESKQHQGKAPVEEAGDASSDSANGPPKPPPPSPARMGRSRPSAQIRRRGTRSARRTTIKPTPASILAPGWNFPRTTARRTPCRGSTGARPSSATRIC